MTIKRQPDHFYKRAKEENFAARSIYKLEEMDRKYRLFRSGDKILDLGAAPGSWMQYLSVRIGESGLVVCVDKNPLREGLAPNVRFIQGDVLAISQEAIREHCETFDAVVSDLAPKTTGDRTGDHGRSIELDRRAFGLAVTFLKSGGSFVCKMFQGEESRTFLDELRPNFEMLKTQKPEASRWDSREVFIVGLGFRANSSAIGS